MAKKQRTFKISIGTTFSGIGAIEHAFERLNIKHKLVFACDNGGIELFNNKIIDRFIYIDDEIKFLTNHIKNLDLNSEDKYKAKLFSELNKINDIYIELKNKSSLTCFNDMKVFVTQAINLLKEKQLNVREYENKDLDISDYIYLAMELKKSLKSHPKNFKELEAITKDKEFRVLRKEIKEICKKLSQLHESILTLEEIDHIQKLSTNKEKKEYVDSL